MSCENENCLKQPEQNGFSKRRQNALKLQFRTKIWVLEALSASWDQSGVSNPEAF
jgi:hypothetical protein